MKAELRKDIRTSNKRKESLRGSSVEAAFDNSEGNGEICDEQTGEGAGMGWRKPNSSRRGKIGLVPVFGTSG